MFISPFCATQPSPFLLSIWELSIIYMNLGVIDSCCTSTYLAGYMLVWKTHDESRLYVEVGVYQITGILVFLPRNLSRRSCNKNFTLKVKFLFTIQIKVILKKWSPTYRGVLTDLISILFCFSSWFSRKPSRKQKAIIKNLLLSHIVNIRLQLTCGFGGILSVLTTGWKRNIYLCKYLFNYARYHSAWRIYSTSCAEVCSLLVVSIKRQIH